MAPTTTLGLTTTDGCDNCGRDTTTTLEWRVEVEADEPNQFEEKSVGACSDECAEYIESLTRSLDAPVDDVIHRVPIVAVPVAVAA